MEPHQDIEEKEIKGNSMSHDYLKLMSSLQQIQSKLEKVSPDGLVTFSFRGMNRTILRADITRWTGDFQYNWFTFYLAEHEKDGTPCVEPIFVNRSPVAIDYILNMLSGIDLDFNLLTALEKRYLMDDIAYFQMEEIADKHLKNKSFSQVIETLAVKRSRRVELAATVGKVLYITTGDASCHPEQCLTQFQPVIVKTITERSSFLEYEVVIISASATIGVNQDVFGDMLADYVDKGGNVVVCGLSNTTSWWHGASNFSEYNPFRLKVSVTSLTPMDRMGWFDKDHPLMKGINSLRIIAAANKVHGELCTGDVEVVARWSDGSNMIAIRHDKKGLITSIGFPCGLTLAGGDVTSLLLNAIQLRKSG
jgi:hypothetical protein